MNRKLFVLMVMLSFSCFFVPLVFAACVEDEPCTEGAPIDAAVSVKETAKDPVILGNKICPVMGAPIAAGQEIQVTYDGKIVNLCCSGCVEAFHADPEKYIKIVEEELAQSAESENVDVAE